MPDICACGHVIVFHRGAWIHDGTGWRMCDLTARTFAEPYIPPEPEEG